MYIYNSPQIKVCFSLLPRLAVVHAPIASFAFPSTFEIPKQNATEFLRERFKRHNPGKTLLGSDSGAQVKGFPSKATLTPAETSLLKALTTDGAGGNYGVAGVSGLDRLMRVMINAPDVSLETYRYPRLLSSTGHRLQPTQGVSHPFHVIIS